MRYESINEFERHLARNGTVILKFFLNVSKKEQKKRFLARLDDPDKNWKFSPSDLEERNFWDDYQKAYEQALSATSTKWGPWHVIPADNKWVARAVVARIIAGKIRSLDLRYPEVDDKKRALLEEARKELGKG
jgi:polyphosphate kinase 2 (PPK2 family)